MFWYNQLFWYGFAIILVLTFISLAIAIYVRRRRSENRFYVVIENESNVSNAFLLRLENEDRSFEYQFQENGQPLPIEKISTTMAPSSTKTLQGVGNGAQALSQAQSASLSVDRYAPSEVSAPLTRISSEISAGQREAGTLQYYLAKLGIPANSQKQTQTPQTRSNSTPTLIEWAVTHQVPPGGTVKIDLSVLNKSWIGQEWPFQVVSRVKEVPNAPEVTQAGTGVVRGKFWTHPVLPTLVIVAVAVVLLILTAVLTNTPQL